MPENANCNNVLSTRELSAGHGHALRLASGGGAAARRASPGGTTQHGREQGHCPPAVPTSLWGMAASGRAENGSCRAAPALASPAWRAGVLAELGAGLSMARSTGHTKTSKPTKAAHGDPGRPTMRVCPCWATATLRPGLVATPRKRISAPRAAIARAAKSWSPRPEAPRMTTTSVSSPRVSWVVRLSSVSGTMPRLTLVHPSSWARISRAYRLLHHFFPGCHGAPGGKSSLPGATSATRGRRITSTRVHAKRQSDANALRGQALTLA